MPVKSTVVESTALFDESIRRRDVKCTSQLDPVLPQRRDARRLYARASYTHTVQVRVRAAGAGGWRPSRARVNEARLGTRPRPATSPPPPRTRPAAAPTTPPTSQDVPGHVRQAAACGAVLRAVRRDTGLNGRHFEGCEPGCARRTSSAASPSLQDARLHSSQASCARASSAGHSRRA